MPGPTISNPTDSSPNQGNGIFSPHATDQQDSTRAALLNRLHEYQQNAVRSRAVLQQQMLVMQAQETLLQSLQNNTDAPAQTRSDAQSLLGGAAPWLQSCALLRDEFAQMLLAIGRQQLEALGTSELARGVQAIALRQQFLEGHFIPASVAILVDQRRDFLIQNRPYLHGDTDAALALATSTDSAAGPETQAPMEPLTAPGLRHIYTTLNAYYAPWVTQARFFQYGAPVGLNSSHRRFALADGYLDIQARVPQWRSRDFTVTTANHDFDGSGMVWQAYTVTCYGGPNAERTDTWDFLGRRFAQEISAELQSQSAGHADRVLDLADNPQMSYWSQWGVAISSTALAARNAGLRVVEPARPGALAMTGLQEQELPMALRMATLFSTPYEAPRDVLQPGDGAPYDALAALIQSMATFAPDSVGMQSAAQPVRHQTVPYVQPGHRWGLAGSQTLA